MSICKKVLLIALGISTYNAALSMQDNDTIRSRAIDILKYARKAQHNSSHMMILGNWLTQQRTNCTEIEDWNNLIDRLIKETKAENKLIEKLRGEHCMGATSYYLTKEIIKIVADVAYNLEPNKTCSDLLVDRAQKCINKHHQILLDGPH